MKMSIRHSTVVDFDAVDPYSTSVPLSSNLSSASCLYFSNLLYSHQRPSALHYGRTRSRSQRPARHSRGFVNNPYPLNCHIWSHCHVCEAGVRESSQGTVRCGSLGTFLVRGSNRSVSLQGCCCCNRTVARHWLTPVDGSSSTPLPCHLSASYMP